MKLNCEERMEQYLMLDKGKRIPMKLSLHLLTCPECRKQVEVLSHAEKIAAEPLRIPTPIKSDSIRNITRSLDPLYKPRKFRIPLWLWITVGIIMIAALLFFPGAKNPASDRNMLIAFYLVFAGAVTIYSASFIGANLDVLIKKTGASPA